MDYSKLTPTRLVMLVILLVASFVALFGPPQVAEWVEYLLEYFTTSRSSL